MLIVVSTGCPSTATPVRGPDGEDDWLSVECGMTQTNCYDRAAEECPQGYVVADSGSAGGRGYRGHMLIKCSKHVSADAEDGPAYVDTQAEARRAFTLCKSDLDGASAMATMWSEWFGGDALESPPDASAFMHLCGTLSHSAAQCLNADYAGKHKDECNGVFLRLPAPTRQAIGALLVKHDEASE